MSDFDPKAALELCEAVDRCPQDWPSILEHAALARQLRAAVVEIERLQRQITIDLEAARTLRPRANSVGDMAVVVGARIAELEAEVERLKADAERLDWLDHSDRTQIRTVDRQNRSRLLPRRVHGGQGCGGSGEESDASNDQQD